MGQDHESKIASDEGPAEGTLTRRSLLKRTGLGVLGVSAIPGLLERVLATGRVTLRADRELRAAQGAAVTIVQAGAIGPLFEERLDGIDAIVETEGLASAPVPAWLAEALPAGQIRTVGDCLRPRSALEAIHEGALAGLAV